MLLQDVVRVLVRRWLVFVPVVLLTAACSVFAFTSVAPTYTSSAAVLMLPPEAPATAAEGTAENPIRGFDGGLVAAGTVVSIVLMDAKTSAEVKSQGVEEYEVGIDPSSVAPIVNMTVVSRDAQTAMKSMDGLLRSFAAELAARQRALQAPSETWIRSSVLSRSPVPSGRWASPSGRPSVRQRSACSLPWD